MMKHVPSSVCFCTDCKRYTEYEFIEIQHCIISSNKYINEPLVFAICKECRKKLKLHWINIINKCLGNDKYYEALANNKVSTIKMDFCYNCRKYTQYRLQKAKINKVIDGKNYTFNITIAVCNECGNEITPLGLIDYNIKEFEEQYKEKVNNEGNTFKTKH